MIECYYAECPNHCVHGPDANDGPFCDNLECTATDEQLAAYKVQRDAYLEELRVLRHDS